MKSNEPVKPTIVIWRTDPATGKLKKPENFLYPFVMVDSVKLATTSDMGSASLRIPVGYWTVETQNGNVTQPNLGNLYNIDSETFIDRAKSYRGAWVAIYWPDVETEKGVISGLSGKTLTGLPADTQVFSSDAPLPRFFGRVFNVDIINNTLSGYLALSAVDFIGYLKQTPCVLLPVSSDTEIRSDDSTTDSKHTVGFAPVTTDLNCKDEAGQGGNRDTEPVTDANNRKTTLSEGYDLIGSDMAPYVSSDDWAVDIEGYIQDWTSYSVASFVLDQAKLYLQKVFDNIKLGNASLKVDINWHGHELELVKIKEKYPCSGRSFGDILDDAIDRKRGWICYSDFDGTKITLHVQKVTDAPSIDFTDAAGYPSRSTNLNSVVSLSQQDWGSHLVIKTKPCTVVGTWNMLYNFRQGWADLGTEPDLAELETVYKDVYRRYILKKDVIRGWNSVAGIGSSLGFFGSTAESATLADNASLNFTCDGSTIKNGGPAYVENKFLTALPFGSSALGNAVSVDANFRKITTISDKSGTSDPVAFQYDNGFVNAFDLIKTIKSQDGSLLLDFSTPDLIADVADRKQWNLTLPVQVGPITQIIKNPAWKSEEISIKEVVLDFDPVIFLSGTVLGLDADDKAIVYAPVSGSFQVINYDSSDIVSAFASTKEFWLKEKIKVSFTVNQIVTNLQIGTNIGNMEIPNMLPLGSEAPIDSYRASWRLLPCNSFVNSIYYDFLKGTTAVATDFANYGSKK